MSKRIRISCFNHTVTAGSSYLFDTNIWLSLYHPQSNVEQRPTKAYADLLGKILSSQAEILITFTILSEYANRIIKDYKEIYEESQHLTISMKDYRETVNYDFIITTVKNNIQDILGLSNVANYEFDNSSLGRVLDFKTENSLDVNDRLIELVAKERDAYIVTHDFDFRSSNCNIVSDNKKFFYD